MLIFVSDDQRAPREPDPISRRRSWTCSESPEDQDAVGPQDQRPGQGVLRDFAWHAPAADRCVQR